MSAGEPCVERLLRAMRDPAVERIVLYGLGGIGKTWAARRAADRAKQSSLFDVTIWVSLSACSTARQVPEMIINSLPISTPDGGNDGDGEEEEDAPRLWTARRRVYRALLGTKFLLILDGLLLIEDDVLGMIGIPARDPAVGSKVLITTRSQRVLVTTQPDLLIEMAGLPFRESLGLFQEVAGEAVACSQSSPDSSLMHEVVRRCWGIPLAVALVGGALRGKADALAIESTLMEAASALGQGTACTSVTYRAAKLGYLSLPNDAVKELLRKCVLFHQDSGIPTHALVRFGYSRGIMDGMVPDDVYETVRAVLTELLSRRLLCEDGDGRVVAQTVVREVLLGTVTEGEKMMLWRLGPRVTSLPGGWEDKWWNYETIALMDTMIEALPGSPRCPRLSTLLLNGNHLLRRIPESFFTHMQCLRVLDLSDTGIGHLPSSLGELFELRLLLLRRCVRLEEVANLTANLEVLDLSGATSTKRIAWGPSPQASPSLTVLNLSDTSVEELQFLVNLRNLRQLSLSGCRHLKAALHLSSLSKLELLDLSGTMLVEFPYGISELTQLKRLRLVGSKYTRVEWRMIHWLPEGLVWDQSTGSDITAEAGASGDGTTFISANDPGVLCVDGDSPLWRNCFKKFHFSLCLGDAAGSDDVRFQRKEFVFRDAYFKTRHFVPCEHRDRYLEIRGAHGFPYGIEGVLRNSELVALANIKFMKRLSDLGLQDMRGMKECWIERCDQMETVLDDQEAEFLGAQGSLECLWVSNSMSLRSLLGKMGRAAGSFACLKHLNLDCCPSLFCVFSSAVRLQNLETFQIKFCDELETVFGDPVSGEDAFPRLHSMRLWELPRLSNISDGALPALKNLKVKQCPMLMKIPVSAGETSPLVLIVGEPWWWNNLKWDDQAIKRHLLFRRWGRF